MLDLRNHKQAWPDHLEPRGKGFYRESFAAWWDRHSNELRHLHPQIAEQWVHRHWRYSPYSFLPLDDLSWSQEEWATSRILKDVFVNGWPLDPDHDYRVFAGMPDHSTTKPLNQTGTWDYPIVTLETPGGFQDHSIHHPEVGHLLIEGHSRMRYMNALSHRGKAAPYHSVFILRRTKAG